MRRPRCPGCHEDVVRRGPAPKTGQELTNQDDFLQRVIDERGEW